MVSETLQAIDSGLKVQNVRVSADGTNLVISTPLGAYSLPQKDVERLIAASKAEKKAEAKVEKGKASAN
jgi:hypothetical protein